MALRLDSEGTEAVLLADVALHPALLERAGLGLRLRRESGRSAPRRVARCCRSSSIADVLVACGHYPGTGIGRVVTRDGRVVWEEA